MAHAEAGDGSGPPTLGVVVTIFHRAGFYRDALRSVAAQAGDLPEIELVVVCTSDLELELPESIRRRGWVCRVLRNDAVGEGPFLQPALAELKSEFVLPLDDDDVWEPGRLAHVAEVLRQHPDASYYHNAQSFIDARGDPLPTNAALRHMRRFTGAPRGPLRALRRAELRRHPGQLARYGSVFNNSSVAVRRSALLASSPELARAEWLYDLFMFYAAVCEADRVVFDPAPLTRYRIHAWNRSRGAQTLGRFETAAPSRSRAGRLATIAVLREMVERRGQSWLVPWVEHDRAYFDTLEALREGDSDPLETLRRVIRLAPYWRYADPVMNAILGLTALGQVLAPIRVRRAYWAKGAPGGPSSPAASESK